MPPTLPLALTPADIEVASPAVLALDGTGCGENRTRRWRRAPRARPSTSLDPPSGPQRRFLKLGDFAFEKRDWKQAESAFNKAVRNSPMNANAARATMRLGDVQFAQARYEEAIKRYEEVLQVKEWKGELWPRSPLHGRREPEELRERKRKRMPTTSASTFFIPTIRSGRPKLICAAPRSPRSLA